MPPVDPETYRKLKPFIEKMQGQTRNELFPEKPNRKKKKEQSTDVNEKIREKLLKLSFQHIQKQTPPRKAMQLEKTWDTGTLCKKMTQSHIKRQSV